MVRKVLDVFVFSSVSRQSRDVFSSRQARRSRQGRDVCPVKAGTLSRQGRDIVPSRQGRFPVKAGTFLKRNDR